MPLTDQDSLAFDDLYEAQEALNERACLKGRQMIRDRLKALETRFTRHRFRYVDGMGTMALYCTPAIFGSKFAGRDETSVEYGMRFNTRPCDALDFLQEQHEELMEFACQIGDDFSTDFGEVTTSNEDEDTI